MATSVKTFSNASVKGWNNVTLADLTGLPSIPANAVLNDVKLTCSVSRNGKGPTIADGDIDFKIGGSDTVHTAADPGRNGTTNSDFSIMSKVVNNNGTLSYSSGATYIRVEVYHRRNDLTGQSTWTLSNAKITAYYTIPTYTITTAVTPANSGTVTGGDTFESGSSITLTATPATGYKFKQWNDGNTSATRTITVTGNATYTATFEKLKYTVTWKNHDGTTLETDNNVEYGTTPTYNGATPTKASTAQHSYAFNSWSPAVSAVTGNATYTAQFTSTVRKYTVKWYNYDGTLLETDTDVPYGTKPTYNGATPTKPSDDYYNYGFAGWSPSIEDGIQGDKNFTAQFAQTDRYYTVRWVNASAVEGVEGELLETDTVKFNTQPDYNGATPKHPKQDTDPALNYDFIGWSAKVTDPAKPDTELETVKGNITYTAIYETTPKLYAITVILFDSQSTDIYEYGKDIIIEAPAVTGYQFVKWSDGNTDNPHTVKVTGEATYEAEYEILKFNVIWKNSDVNNTILEIDENVLYNDIPKYNGETPTKQPTQKYTYEFLGWDKEITGVTEDTVYIAVYDEIINEYLVEGTTDRGGSVTGTGVYQYGTLVTLVATPLPGYKFVKWHDGDTSAIKEVYVTGEVSYLAIFIAQNIYRGLVTFVNPYIGASSNVIVYKGTNKIYE